MKDRIVMGSSFNSKILDSNSELDEEDDEDETDEFDESE